MPTPFFKGGQQPSDIPAANASNDERSARSATFFSEGKKRGVFFSEWERRRVFLNEWEKCGAFPAPFEKGGDRLRSRRWGICFCLKRPHRPAQLAARVLFAAATIFSTLGRYFISRRNSGMWVS